jgi:hypothetical protein
MAESWNPSDFAKLRPPEVFGHLGYAERRLPDGLLGNWEIAPLPADAAVTHVILVPFRGQRPVLTFHNGRLSLLEGEAHPGETPDQTVARVAMEQAGISELTWKHLGHLRCRATIYSEKQEAGTITYRPFYALDVVALADFPSDPAYERRIVTQRDLNDVVRSNYVELRREYMEALDGFVLERIKAASAGTAAGP